jgi:hypothetical protein
VLLLVITLMIRHINERSQYNRIVQIVQQRCYRNSERYITQVSS